MAEVKLLMPRYWKYVNRYHTAEMYPKCPWCGLHNYSYECGDHIKHGAGDSRCGYVWNGPRRALDAGKIANLWIRKGRIYGGAKPHSPRWFRNGPAPQRVNEKHWKIVRVGRSYSVVGKGMHSGPKRYMSYVACAHPFHDDRTK